MTELDLVTTRDLINELVRRSTFAGVVIRSKDLHTQEGQVHSDFEVSTSLEPETTIELLEKVTELLETEQ